MLGMFGLAVITDLIFVRFSRPTARMHFSKLAVIAPFDGVPNLMIRIANLRHQAMVEPEFRMILLRDSITAEGGVPPLPSRLRPSKPGQLAYPARRRQLAITREVPVRRKRRLF
jgi:Inward rectifier potassium channel C-terminal domain